MRMRKADSTLRSSRAVPHPNTNRALRRLTSEVRRDPVHSTRYGRQRNYSKLFDVRGALIHEAFFDLPSLSPPCKQSRESFTIAGGSGYWQTLALVLSIIATTSFCFAAVRTGSPKSGCKFHRSHFGSRCKLGCCGHASLFAACSDSCWLAHCTWCIKVVECGVLLGICRSGVSALTRARSRALHYHRPIQAHPENPKTIQNV